MTTSTDHADHFHRVVPLERFREILGALDVEHHSLNDARFLRFAALTAVMTPDQPAEIARRMHEAARLIDDRAPWFSTLSSGPRFIVAAALADSHEHPNLFLSEHKRLHEAFAEHGLPRGGIPETMAILILHLAAGRHLVDLWTLARMRHVYDAMKERHWWLTGSDDLPACAALTAIEGDVEQIVADIERVYQDLHEGGLATGDRLQSAANLLPLTHCSVDELLARYNALLIGIDDRGPVELREEYSALALLASLDHPAKRVLETYQAVRKELDFSQLMPAPHNNTLLAADLTVIDLARFDRDLEPPKDAHAAQAVVERLNHYRIAALVLACESEPWEAISDQTEAVWPFV